MSFLSGIVDFAKSAVGIVSGNSIFGTLARTAILGYAVNRLSKSANKGQDSGTNNIDEGVRLQVKPNADSKIPVLYGSAFFGGNIIDAAMTNSNKTMWFALALTEKTGSLYSTSSATTYLLNNVYLNDQRVQFQGDGITVDYTLDRAGTIDRNASGLIQIYFYAGGRTAGQKPVGFAGAVANAETLFPNWTSGTHALTNVVFALVKVDYNRDKGVTGLPDVKFNIASSMFTPGDVIYDYLTNTTYGAGISAGDILTTDITALNTYSLASVAYADQGTGAQTLGDRYQINGLIDTANTVLENSEAILNATASWLSYDTHEGKWGVIINKAETSVAAFDDTNIIGNISVSGTGLQDLYNAVKVQFPHRELRDNADFYNISVPTSSIPADWSPFSLNTNEEPKTLNITYDIVNEPIQAQMLGLIELKQSRIDKVIQFKTDWTYYNLKAGDVIDVTNSRFGFSAKLFRIIAVKEQQDNDGALMMDITALEYNANVYSVVDLYRFTRSDANGIITFGSIGTPGTPTVSKVEIDSRPRVQISSTAPTGIVEALEFWLSNDVSLADANRSYRVISVERPVGGGVYTSGTAVTFEYDSVSSSDFVVKTRGINTATTGPFSAVSGLVNFVPRQTTQAVDASTSMFDSAGGLLGALSLVSLLSKVSDLFGSGDTSKSLFTRIFETFQSTTGLDILGTASGGSLVVASSLTVKADTVNLTTAATSVDFKTPLLATGGPAVEVKIKPGVKNKDILAYNKETAQWQTISDCVVCDFVNTPPADEASTSCKLIVASKSPASNFGGVDSGTGVCVTASNVPFVGSYFIQFNLQQERLGRTPGLASTISPTTDYKYKIAQAGTTDFTFWGAANNTVGTEWFATSPATNFPTGKTLDVITVGKRYKIRTVGSTTTAQWKSIGVDDAATPAVDLEFIATATLSPVYVGSGTVKEATGSGWVYGPPGAFKTSVNTPGFVAKPAVSQLVKGTGSFKLYTTNGDLVETLPVANTIIHTDIVELPFKDRKPGTDYYINWTAGIVTNCTCENDAIEVSENWTFTTSLTPVTALVKPGGAAQFTYDINDQRTNKGAKIQFTPTPLGTLCLTNQTLVLTFGTKMKKGSGSVTFTDRLTGSVAASLSVSAATISAEGDKTPAGVAIPVGTQITFGTITGLSEERIYDVSAPQGLLLTDIPASESGTCDQIVKTLAQPSQPSEAKKWQIRTEVPLAVVRVEVCTSASGNATPGTNIKIHFNKAISIKATGPAFVSILNTGLFSPTHQKIDLKGTYASKKYGDIYNVSGKVLTLQPTEPLKGNTNYYINIDAGTLLDTACNVAFPGISDTTTAAFKTDGAVSTPPQKLSGGSTLIKMEFDRPVTPGPGMFTIIKTNGQVLTQFSSTDLAVRFRDNQPF